MMAFV